MTGFPPPQSASCSTYDNKYYVPKVSSTRAPRFETTQLRNYVVSAATFLSKHSFGNSLTSGKRLIAAMSSVTKTKDGHR
jgi:hypothetical protein